MKGYTLIEVMVAMTVLSVGMLGLTALQISGIRGNSTSSINTEVGTMLKYHMESIIHADYDHPFLQDINKSNNRNLLSTTQTDFKNMDMHGNPLKKSVYTLIWNVADNEPIENTKTIVVIVTWKNGKQKRHVACVKSMVSG